MADRMIKELLSLGVDLSPDKQKRLVEVLMYGRTPGRGPYRKQSKGRPKNNQKEPS